MTDGLARSAGSVDPHRRGALLTAAGVTLGWQKYVGSDGLMFGIDSFGASGPIEALYEHFGLSAEYIYEAIVSKL